MTREQLVRLECLYRGVVGPFAYADDRGIGAEPEFVLEPGDHPCVIVVRGADADNLCERCMSRETGMLIAQLMADLPGLIAAARVGVLATELIEQAKRGAL